MRIVGLFVFFPRYIVLPNGISRRRKKNKQIVTSAVIVLHRRENHSSDSYEVFFSVVVGNFDVLVYAHFFDYFIVCRSVPAQRFASLVSAMCLCVGHTCVPNKINNIFYYPKLISVSFSRPAVTIPAANVSTAEHPIQSTTGASETNIGRSA